MPGPAATARFTPSDPDISIIGVDLTDAMLDQARQRVAQHGWKNVTLVQGDAAQYEFPALLDGILSTFALTFVPDCARVIQNGARALKPGRRWVVLDMAWSARVAWPLWMRHLLFILPSYGITADVIQRHPWQTTWGAMERQLVDVAKRSKPPRPTRSAIPGERPNLIHRELLPRQPAHFSLPPDTKSPFHPSLSPVWCREARRQILL
jgi:SAM-dependent methyltransferase